MSLVSERDGEGEFDSVESDLGFKYYFFIYCLVASRIYLKEGRFLVVTPFYNLQVAVRAWGRLLAQVLDEEALSSEPSSLTSLPSPEISKCIPGSLSSARTSAELEHLMLKNQRSAAWFSHADSKLIGNVQAVCAVHQHSHFKVRLEMVQTAQLLLTKCSRYAIFSN